MAAANRKGTKHLPPCPDPERYVRVDTREGSYWRRKRGTVKPALLNERFAANNRAYKVLMPAAARVVHHLEPYTRGLRPGRITARIAALWLPDYLSSGRISFTALEKLEFQPESPTEKLLKGGASLLSRKLRTTADGAAVHTLSIAPDKGSVQAQNDLVTDYYFELILLYGDCTQDGGLSVCSGSSALYRYGEEPAAPCVMELTAAPAGEPWMLLLKLNSLEGPELAVHCRHYAMLVVKAG